MLPLVLQTNGQWTRSNRKLRDFTALLTNCGILDWPILKTRIGRYVDEDAGCDEGCLDGHPPLLP